MGKKMGVGDPLAMQKQRHLAALQLAAQKIAAQQRAAAQQLASGMTINPQQSPPKPKMAADFNQFPQQGIPSMQQQQQYQYPIQGLPNYQQMQGQQGYPQQIQGYQMPKPQPLSHQQLMDAIARSKAQQEQQYYAKAMLKAQQDSIQELLKIQNKIQQKSRKSILNKSGFHLIKFPTTKQSKEDTKELKLSSVIITICDGSSYDSLFSSVEQKSGDGSRVSVYSCTAKDIKQLIIQLKDSSDEQISNQRSDDLDLLLNDLREIEDPSCVA